MLPAWAPKNLHVKEWLSVAHLALAWALALALAVHLAGVAKHVLVDRDAILRRMAWPRRAPALARDEAAGHLRA